MPHTHYNTRCGKQPRGCSLQWLSAWRRICDLLDQLGLVQHVKNFMHFDVANDHGNIFDLLITPETSSLVTATSVVTTHHLSNHRLIVCDIKIERTKILAPTWMARNIKTIEKADFVCCLHGSALFTNNTVDGYTDQIEKVMTERLDSIALLRPVHDNFAPARQLLPEAVAAKHDRWAKKRQWKQSKKEVDRLSTARHVAKPTTTGGIKINSVRLKTVPVTWSILHPTTHQPTSTPDEDKSRATSYASFFHDKVINTGCPLARNSMVSFQIWCEMTNHSVDKSFTTCHLVQKLLSSMSGMSSSCDFVPTSLLKECSEAFATIITLLANLSFLEGAFPTILKMAKVTQILKKVGMTASDPSNHRPMSNLNTISEVLKRLLLAHLIPHVSTNLCRLQSAHHQYHSTEMPLLRISNDFLKLPTPRSHFWSVSCIQHDWPFGSPSTATPHFWNQRLCH